MQTQVMTEGVVGIPWLEHRGGEGVQAEQTFVCSFPFSIGRSGEVDLQVDSSRVSRSHARIVQEGNGYRLRDLNSTNGTTINGSRIDDAPLAEGDIVGIADIEFVFHSSNSNSASSVTQAMSDEPRPRAPGGDVQVGLLIRTVRKVHELTSRCRVGAPLEAIVELEHGAVFGYGSLLADRASEAAAAEVESLLLATTCPLTQRLRELHQLVVTEAGLQRCPDARMFLELQPTDLEDRNLLKGLRRLCRMVPEPSQVVLALPVALVGESVEFATMYARLRDLGLGLAYRDVLDGQSLVRRLSATPADFLILSPTLTEGIEHDEDRQRHVRSIVQAGDVLECQVIASGIGNQDQAMACLNVGCRFGQGPHFQETA
jgi:pSer/pThr/pTyr-binding forkhead associated (FHA) protein